MNLNKIRQTSSRNLNNRLDKHKNGDLKKKKIQQLSSHQSEWQLINFLLNVRRACNVIGGITFPRIAQFNKIHMPIKHGGQAQKLIASNVVGQATLLQCVQEKKWTRCRHRFLPQVVIDSLPVLDIHMNGIKCGIHGYQQFSHSQESWPVNPGGRRKWTYLS